MNTQQNEKYTIFPNGLIINGFVTFDEWKEIGREIQFERGKRKIRSNREPETNWGRGHPRDGTQWIIGDWLKYGKEKFGERYLEEVGDPGSSQHQTLSDYRMTSEGIEIARRVGSLAFAHHVHVRDLERSIQDRLLKQAVDQGLGSHEIRRLATKERQIVRAVRAEKENNGYITCRKCGETKTLESFAASNRRNVGRYRSKVCRTCAALARVTKVKQTEDVRKAKKAIRDRQFTVAQRWVFSYLNTHPCVDCGEANVLVLEFDHVLPGKTAEISKLVRKSSTRRLEEEIKLCVVRCANCHRIRHQKQSNSWLVRLISGIAASNEDHYGSVEILAVRALLDLVSGTDLPSRITSRAVRRMAEQIAQKSEPNTDHGFLTVLRIGTILSRLGLKRGSTRKERFWEVNKDDFLRLSDIMQG